MTLGPLQHIVGLAQKPKMLPVFSNHGPDELRPPSKMTFFIDTDPEESESDGSNYDQASPTYSTESVCVSAILALKLPAFPLIWLSLVSWSVNAEQKILPRDLEKSQVAMPTSQNQTERKLCYRREDPGIQLDLPIWRICSCQLLTSETTRSSKLHPAPSP